MYHVGMMIDGMLLNWVIMDLRVKYLRLSTLNGGPNKMVDSYGMVWVAAT